jgi:asparagine synthase (glutamine-hydrolysing)
MFNRKIKSYTLNTKLKDGSDNPEIVRVIKLTEKLQIENQLVEIDKKITIKKLEEMFEIFGEPMSFIEPHHFLTEKLILNNDRVVLCGLGPDELLNGYEYYKKFNSINNYRFMANFLPNINLNNKIGRAVDIIKSNNEYELYMKIVKRNTFRNRKIYKESLHNEKKNFKYKKFNIEKCFDIFNELDFNIYIGSHHNHTTDAFLMSRGIEGRFPYLDERVVEFMRGLDHKYKYQKNISKYLLKKVAENYLPFEIIYGKKYGFNMYSENILFDKEIKEYEEFMVNKLKKTNILESSLIQRNNLNNSERLYLISLSYFLNKWN